MPQFYLSEDNASSVRRCNQSRRAQELIAVSGVALTGSFASFTGNVESVMVNQVATKDKIRSEAPAKP